MQPLSKAVLRECVANGDFAATLSHIDGFRPDPNQKIMSYIQPLPQFEVEVSSFEKVLLREVTASTLAKTYGRKLEKLKTELPEHLATIILERGISDELLSIVNFPNAAIAQRAQEKLFTQQPTNKQLCSVIRSGAVCAPQAWQLLVSQGPTVKQLLHLMQYADAYKAAAWDELKKHPLLNKSVLYKIAREIQYSRTATPKNILNEAARLLLDATIENQHLDFIIKHFPELQVEAGQILLEQCPDFVELCTIVDKVDTLQRDATKLMIDQTQDNKQLCVIVQKYPSIALEAAHRLLKQNPNDKELHTIVLHIPALVERAGFELIAKEPNNEILIDLILKFPVLRSAAAEILFTRDVFSRPARAGLREIIETLPDLAIPAGTRLLRHDQDRIKTDLHCIIKHIESLRAEAAEVLITRQLNREDRALLAEYAPATLQ